MKVLFAGPSLYGARPDLGDIELRPPARRGDITAAVEDGARVIGLVDGYFGESASVWHKELLRAMAGGVQVFGAASMGALRAAECEPFGMIPVGSIAKAYLSGALTDDAAVALTFYPAELGYMPATEALVDSLHMIGFLRGHGLISAKEAAGLSTVARFLNYRVRTSEAIVSMVLVSPRKEDVLHAYRTTWRSLKTIEALQLVARLITLEPTGWAQKEFDVPPEAHWRWTV